MLHIYRVPDGTLMQNHTNTWQDQLSVTLIIIATVMIVLTPLASNCVPDILDYTAHIFSIEQARTALTQHQFPLRIAPSGLESWPYAYFQFYSPTSYTFSGLIYKWVTPGNPWLAYKITLFLALILGGIYIYRLTAWLSRYKTAAILSSIAYLASPYTIIVTNHIGAFNETIALGILPVTLFYTLNCFFNPSTLALIKTALTWYLLATVHLLTFMSASCFIFLLLILMSCYRHISCKNLITPSLAYLLSIALAAWYFAPIIIYSKHINAVASFDPLYFLKNAPLLTDLLSPFAYIIDKAIEYNAITRIHPTIGPVFLLSFSLGLYAYLKHGSSRSKHMDDLLTPLLTLFIITFVLIWSPINFWELLPRSFLAQQYSWRLLGQINWIGTLLFAWCINYIFKRNNDITRTILSGFLIISFGIPWLLAPESYTPYSELTSNFKNTSFYLLDGLHHSNFTHLIDNLLLDSPTSTTPEPNHLSQVTLPNIIFNPTSKPVIHISGRTPNKPVKGFSFDIYVNHKLIKSFPLKRGEFSWKAPFQNPHDTIFLEFKLKNIKNPQETPDWKLNIDKLQLSGLINPDIVVPPDEVMSHCKQQESNMTCIINTNSNKRLIELPVFYYPDMLSVRVNNIPTTYVSVVYKNQLILGIPALPDQKNTIHIQFHGIQWANYLSQTSWLLCLILIVYLALNYLLYSRNYAKLTK